MRQRERQFVTTIDPATITIDEQIAAAKRELRLRRGVFQKMVDNGKMTADKAGHEIACMRAIIATLEEKQQPGLI